MGSNTGWRKLLERETELCLLGGSGMSFGTGFRHPFGRIPPDASSGFDIEVLADIMTEILRKKSIIAARVGLLRRRGAAHVFMCLERKGGHRRSRRGPTRRDTACSVRLTIGLCTCYGRYESSCLEPPLGKGSARFTGLYDEGQSLPTVQKSG